ncbi:conserved hypothetical protein [Sporisorium reilianum SRZ2]|uniref:Store-operated calcium entry-associated regulatory factor n=1 Tax=Sporisorium reilianum (strain SRZ2) TaxID=999809 RepID=E6ZVX0_SPORE|nr:conserved hypothetical protein [Sporisorium reilianum SRZ2]
MVHLAAMQRRAALLGAVLLALLSAASGYTPNAQYYGAGRRVAMSSIETLTFYAGRRTAFRRTSALPQLTCVGSMCARYQPDVVQCTAMGDAQWKCSADLPRTMRLGRVEVSCEGYDYAQDPYVLKDSCALEYHLLPSGTGPDDPWRTYQRGAWGDKVLDALFQLVFWSVLAVIVVSFVRAIRGGGTRGNSPSTGGGGGGGWWPGSSYPPPPPPYTPKPEPDASSSWTPGFWTGLGLGGLAATAASSSRRRQPNFTHDPPFNAYAGGSTARRRPWDDSSPTSSSAWRESTGFGGTRNR